MALKNFRVQGNNNLKIKSNTATTTTLAKMKFFGVTLGVVLKKYKKPIAGMVNSPIK